MKGDPHRWDADRFRAMHELDAAAIRRNRYDDHDEADGWAWRPDPGPHSEHGYGDLSEAALADQEPFRWSEPRERGAHRAPGRWERLRAWFAGLMSPVFEDDDDPAGTVW